MKKVQFWAVFWTIIIAIPFTTLALIASAYLTDHIVEISGRIVNIDFFTLTQHRDMMLEIEGIGMIFAFVIIIAVIHITLQPGNGEKETHL